jgi:hypothetical protein
LKEGLVQERSGKTGARQVRRQVIGGKAACPWNPVLWLWLSTMKLIAPAPGTRLAALQHEYVAKPLLTVPEERFFRVLAAVSGDRVHIVCKPRLADFIQHSDGLAGFNHISQKHVDFLVCRTGDWMPMLGIEVDDASHNRKDRRERDTFVNNLFAHVGVPLLRIGAREVEDLDVLVARLTDGWHNRCRHLEMGE